MKKKILAVALAAIMLLVAITGATLAYLTDTDAKQNTFTVGNVSIVLTEPKWDAVGAAEASDVYPGEALAKDPTVTNDGKNPCFVRIKIDNLDQYVEKYGEDAMIIYRTNYVDNALSADWVLLDDGYFYYTKVLASGATTDPLFDQIVIPFALTNNEEAKPIDVYAEAVQAQGARPSFTAVNAMTPAEIAAWFATCMPADKN